MPEETASGTRELTGEEAALYDRQIRLWGLEAQRRLASSHILIAGAACSPLGHEVAKNVVLAGIARLGLCGAGAPSSPAFLGADVAATAESLREMNPHVEISVVDAIVPHVGDYSVVCTLSLPREEELRVSRACREKGVAFMAGRCAGSAGWFFADLGKSYCYQQKKMSDQKDQGGEFVYVTKDGEDTFCSYEEAVAAPWGRETRRSEFGWHVASTLLEFESANGRLPKNDEGDMQALGDLYAKLSADKKCARSNRELIVEVGKTSQFSLPPIAAIVGGMWGRELVKFVSRKDPPINNFFFFNAESSAGSVERIGA